MANSLATLVKERHTRKRKPKKGRPRKMFNYSWPQRVNLLRLYFELLARGNPPAAILKWLRCSPGQIELWIREKQLVEEQNKMRDELNKQGRNING